MVSVGPSPVTTLSFPFFPFWLPLPFFLSTFALLILAAGLSTSTLLTFAFLAALVLAFTTCCRSPWVQDHWHWHQA